MEITRLTVDVFALWQAFFVCQSGTKDASLIPQTPYNSSKSVS